MIQTTGYKVTVRVSLYTTAKCRKRYSIAFSYFYLPTSNFPVPASDFRPSTFDFSLPTSDCIVTTSTFLLQVHASLKESLFSWLQAPGLQPQPHSLLFRQGVLRSILRLKKYRTLNITQRWVTAYYYHLENGTHRSPVQQALTWLTDTGIPHFELLEPNLVPNSPSCTEILWKRIWFSQEHERWRKQQFTEMTSLESTLMKQ